MKKAGRKIKQDTDEAKVEPEKELDSIVNEIDLDEEMPLPEVKKKSMKDVMAIINKKYGDRTMVTLGSMPDFPRLPSGVHAVDYAIGGGFPIPHTSCLYGGFSSGKTTLGLNTLAVSQVFCNRCYRPEKYCVCSTSPFLMDSAIANVEGTLDRVWAKTIGVDVDRVYPIQGENAEMYVDILEQVIQVDDCGFVLFDSIGALLAQAEIDNSAESSNMGVSAKVITKLAKKIKQVLIDEAKRGHNLTLLYINQRRTDLKVKFGSNEAMNGGDAFKHDQSITLRCGKISLNDAEKKTYGAKKEGDRDAGTKHSVIVHKAKVFTLGASASYVRSVDYAHPAIGNASGQVMDFKFLIDRAVEFGLLGDTPTKQLVFMDEKFKTQKELITYLGSNFQAKLMLSMLIVEKAKADRRNF